MLPKILHRLLLAGMLFILTIINMLAVDLTGQLARTSSNNRNMTCMFLNNIHAGKLSSSSSSLVCTHLSYNLVKALALDLIMATSFEFISAQSPHTMKGVLDGLLFAVRGLFQLIEATLLIFSLNQFWDMVAESTPVFTCEFSYYLATTLIAIVGFILLMIAVRKYKYRKREEEPYSQSQVEEIYERMPLNRERAIAKRKTNGCQYTEGCFEA